MKGSPPRWLDDEPSKPREGELALEDDLASTSISQPDAITGAGPAHFQAAYPGEAVTKDGLFYYVYGLLHSEEYRTRFAGNLSKQLPRVPVAKTLRRLSGLCRRWAAAW